MSRTVCDNARCPGQPLAAAGSALALALSSLLALGCGGSEGDGGGPDAGDPGLADATGANTAGLVFSFDTDPRLPSDGEEEEEPRIDSAEFVIRQIRAIGDAAPGDSRTTLDVVDLAWPDGGVDGGDNRVAFPDAPAGIYSWLMGEVASYRIRGTVTVDGESGPFEIIDAPPSALSFEVPLGEVLLVAGQIREIAIEIELEGVVKAASWSDIEPNGDGVRVIDDSEGVISDIRERIQNGFDRDD
jgi:hypothetical protein